MMTMLNERNEFGAEWEDLSGTIRERAAESVLRILPVKEKISARFPPSRGPFVYRLGRKILNL